mmetsp:Transcript_7076/g.14180  ORF Transcript_7076/g.14180 Transcript_7076/m.14180 type:complete len:256 (+) Transcript_7076:403-1170(+)
MCDLARSATFPQDVATSTDLSYASSAFAKNSCSQTCTWESLAAPLSLISYAVPRALRASASFRTREFFSVFTLAVSKLSDPSTSHSGYKTLISRLNQYSPKSCFALSSSDITLSLLKRYRYPVPSKTMASSRIKSSLYASTSFSDAVCSSSVRASSKTCLCSSIALKSTTGWYFFRPCSSFSTARILTLPALTSASEIAPSAKSTPLRSTRYAASRHAGPPRSIRNNATLTKFSRTSFLAEGVAAVSNCFSSASR